MLKLHLRPEARRDLERIREFGYERWGTEAVLRYLSTLHQRIETLLAYPETGRTRNEVAAGLRSVRCGSHITFYRISGDELVVTRFLHGAADPSNARGD